MAYYRELTLKSELNEIFILEEFLVTVCEECEVSDEVYPDIMLAVTEACTNGIIHGNEFDPSKVVTVKTTISEDNQLIFTVVDQGKGFDPNNLPNPVDEENLLKSGGRGVYLMKYYSGSVKYNTIGNEVVLSFNHLA